ncbi:MAG: hypothetical protein IPJ41_05430 [Phycisphaerales bacterium]|nr:hypothetical protein [Phycisphaerales bacterium]
MRCIAFILIWVSLAAGVIAATTAYVWRLPPPGSEGQLQIGVAPDESPIYAVLAADAGRRTDGAPVARSDAALTPELVTELRAAGVQRVRVKTFQISRWTHFPQFLVACVGLLAGAILTRLSAARAASLAEAAQDAGDALGPDAALAALQQVTNALIADIPALGGPQAVCLAIADRIGVATRDLVPLIVDARGRLVARMGLGAYAGFMDVFAAGERNLNRAWSAASDGAEAEAVEALERASERLVVAQARLTGRTSSLLPLA